LAVFYGFMRGLVGYVKIQSGRDRGVITEEIGRDDGFDEWTIIRSDE